MLGDERGVSLTISSSPSTCPDRETCRYEWNIKCCNGNYGHCMEYQQNHPPKAIEDPEPVADGFRPPHRIRKLERDPSEAPTVMWPPVKLRKTA